MRRDPAPLRNGRPPIGGQGPFPPATGEMARAVERATMQAREQETQPVEYVFVCMFLFALGFFLVRNKAEPGCSLIAIVSPRSDNSRPAISSRSLVQFFRTYVASGPIRGA